MLHALNPCDNFKKMKEEVVSASRIGNFVDSARKRFEDYKGQSSERPRLTKNARKTIK